MQHLHPPQSGSDDCPRVDRLQAYVRGDLPEEDTERIASHLQHCSQCSSMVLTFPELDDDALQEISAGRSAPKSPATIRFDVPTTGGRTQSDSPPSDSPTDSSSPPLSPKPLRVGRYAIRRRLGKGGFGIVYLCHDEELDRLVALKVPHARGLREPEKLRVYRDEARRHAALDHPNIVPIYDVGSTPSVPVYQVSKFIDGGNLAERLKEGPIPPHEAAALVLLLADALDHLHRRNLVHRDVKPRNILLDREGLPYLTDFGLAFRPDAMEELAETGLAGMAGTPAYMSPEQCAGPSDALDGRSDIFSLGIVLYEILTGVKPFQGSRDELLREIRAAHPVSIRQRDSHLPADLEAICRKAMTGDPSHRYATAGHLAEDLRDFLAGNPPRHAATVGPAGKFLLFLRRRRNQVGGLVLFTLVIMALTLFWFRPSPSEKRRLPVSIATIPPGAEVAFFPLDDRTGRPRPDQVQRTRDHETVNLTPGFHLVVAVRKDSKGRIEAFHEVQRLVPPQPTATPQAYHHNRWEYLDGVIRLEPVRLHPAEVPAGMCLFPGASDFRCGKLDPANEKLSPLIPSDSLEIPPFYLDVTEVPRETYHRFKDTYAFRQAEARYPATGISWDDAAGFAEAAGKRLPDEYEFEFAASAGGTRRFPWGDQESKRNWMLGPVDDNPNDRLELPGQPTVFGLYSNALEWTASCPAQSDLVNDALPRLKLRIVRGGPPEMAERGSAGASTGGPALGIVERYPYAASLIKPGIGFRCARSTGPRWNAEDFIRKTK